MKDAETNLGPIIIVINVNSGWCSELWLVYYFARFCQLGLTLEVFGLPYALISPIFFTFSLDSTTALLFHM